MSVYLSYWAATSPYGITSLEYRPSGSRTPTSATIPAFEIREVLGAKGTRSMDRVTAIAVHSIKNLIASLPERLLATAAATVLGTTAGSVASTIRFTYDSVTEDRPYLVDPARFPNTVMNCAAGRSAIWHKLQGPNATIAGGPHATALAINYARRLLESGRAPQAIVGAVEELTEERQALHDSSSTRPLAEGGAVFLMTRDRPDDRASLEINEPPAQRLVLSDPERAVSDVIARTGAHRDGPLRVAAVGSASWPDDADRAGQVYLPNAFLGGDAGAAAGALALAAMLSDADPDAPRQSGPALLLSCDERQAVALPMRLHAGVGQAA